MKVSFDFDKEYPESEYVLGSNGNDKWSRVVR